MPCTCTASGLSLRLCALLLVTGGGDLDGDGLNCTNVRFVRELVHNTVGGQTHPAFLKARFNRWIEPLSFKKKPKKTSTYSTGHHWPRIIDALVLAVFTLVGQIILIYFMFLPRFHSYPLAFPFVCNCLVGLSRAHWAFARALMHGFPFSHAFC